MKSQIFCIHSRTISNQSHHQTDLSHVIMQPPTYVQMVRRCCISFYTNDIVWADSVVIQYDTPTAERNMRHTLEWIPYCVQCSFNCLVASLDFFGVAEWQNQRIKTTDQTTKIMSNLNIICDFRLKI